MSKEREALLLKEIKRLRASLEYIENPFARILKEAKENGCPVEPSVALSLANNALRLRKDASETLRATQQLIKELLNNYMLVNCCWNCTHSEESEERDSSRFLICTHSDNDNMSIEPNGICSLHE